jgi:hypothetical protein
MFGGRGAGKSSVLAAVFDQAEKLGAESRLHFDLDSASYGPINNRVRGLKDCFKITEEDPVEISGISNPLSIEEYTFHVRRQGTKDQINLTFIDTSGEMMDKHEGVERLHSAFSECQAAILAIDAVELMNEPDLIKQKIQDRRNNPFLVDRFVKRWINTDVGKQRLLCIVPAKTETYLRQRDTGVSSKAKQKEEERLKFEQEKLLRRVEQEYKDTLSFLKKKVSDKIAVVITPVQTAGNVIFEKYDFNPKPAYPLELWRRIKGTRSAQQDSQGYSPLYCDQPLRHILNFSLLQQIRAAEAEAEKKQSDMYKTIVEMIKFFNPDAAEVIKMIRATFGDLFGQHRDMALSVLSFTGGRKVNPPFKIVQGEQLIHRDENLIARLIKWLETL